MALRKNLAHRFLSLCRSHSAEPLASRAKPAADGLLLQKIRSEQGFFRRVLQNRSIFESSSTSPVALQQRLSLPVGGNLIEKLRSMNGDRIRLDVIHPPIPVPPDREQEETVLQMSVEEARKALRPSRREAVQARLRATGKNSISLAEFLLICDGNVVFLRPDKVANSIETVIPLPLLASEDNTRRVELREIDRRVETAVPEYDSQQRELREMERQKMEIDRRAEIEVRRELWAGMAFLVAQTGAFARLTFWELSWDVMEPICFFVTSVYFILSYAFFLRTSQEPSFQGFFKGRLAAKQRRLMRAANFDLHRFHQLTRALHPSPTMPTLEFPSHRSNRLPSSCDCQHHYCRGNLIDAVH